MTNQIIKHAKKELLPLQKVDSIIAITDKLLGENQYRLFNKAIFLLHTKGTLNEELNYLSLFEKNKHLLIKNENVIFFNVCNKIQFQKALEIFIELIKLENNNKWIFCLYTGICYQKLNQFRKAMNFLEQANHLNINFAPIIHQKAECNFLYLIHKSNKISKRKKQIILMEIIKDTTECIELHAYRIYRNYHFRSYAYEELNELSNAIEDLNELIELEPLAFHYNRRGKLNIYLKQYTNAIEDFDNAISIKPDNNENYKLRALALQKLNRHTEAINNFSKSLELINKESNLNSVFDTLAAIYFLRGNSFFEINQYENALSDYRACQRLDSDSGNKELVNSKIEQTLAKLL